MTEAVATGGLGLNSAADKALKAAAIFWFLAAVIGQWVFVYYIAAHYGGTAVQGDFEAFNKTTIAGHVAGDAVGNLVFAAHVLLAATITFGGTLQLVPQIRARAIGFHRWNGRVFLVTAFAMALGGLYLVWIRDSTTSMLGSVSISLNAALIMICAAMTLRYALARDIDTHRRWALRTFLMVNGVWFLRVGLFAWIILNRGPVGVGENLDGPFGIFLGFACYLLPLGVLELYLRTQDRAGAFGKFAMAGGLFVLTALMAVGIFGAFMFRWRPFL